MRLLRSGCLVLLLVGATIPALATEKAGAVADLELSSPSLEENIIGIDPVRRIKIYLPPGYDTSRKSYPVIYYFHSVFWSNRQMFQDGGVQRLFDRAIAEGTIPPFVFVAGDFTTPHVGTFFGNSPVSGRWIDHIVDEIVPAIDARFRTIRTPAGRGLAGDFLGGYAALKLAMMYPDRFSAVYALHPIGTSGGLIPISSRPDWGKMNRARSWDDLADDGLSQVFMAMAQSYLPNAQRPPFYCDLMVEANGGTLELDSTHAERLQSQFLLDRLLPRYAQNLKRLAGIQFDWGRYDVNQDHVAANQSFTRRLDDLGVPHYAEEYRGNHYEMNWSEHGRVEDRMLPFFARLLAFER
ncbi:pimeloyl-ACP methyl ester carboxylesterase [Povalibacter uvarum]|uniref:Pimeloyl-ACP methyl ester carboxylesterase n=1 Tax=Povalibacter uvarum TaxID=732238 RepID=A0A841HVZ5_9GAMM|nr:alpha/beta hydrolase-fold protein [Povalibacter uvarum]MBB6096122.1 pimeloyl-ACP methyl ester carboxylesterase [Povalibacter uvarum]